MLENYFPTGSGIEKKQRLIALQAALEIAKASVSKGAASTNHHQAKSDIEDVTQSIEGLADALQSILNK